MGWAEITTAITGSVSLVIVIIGFLTGSNPVSQSALMFIQQSFPILLTTSGTVFVGFVLFLIFRWVVHHSIQQGLRHLEIWYFERNANPFMPFGDRIIRNTHTKQAFTVYPALDKMAKMQLIGWRTEPCKDMIKFLEDEHYTFHREQPSKEQLLEGSTLRNIRSSVWFYF